MGNGPRTVHTAWSLLLVAAPCVAVPLWPYRISASHPDDQAPPLAGLMGLPLTFFTLAMITCLVLGRVSAVLVPLLAFATPRGDLTEVPHLRGSTLVRDPRQSTTAWRIPGILLVMAGYLPWQYRSIPKTDRREVSPHLSLVDHVTPTTSVT